MGGLLGVLHGLGAGTAQAAELPALGLPTATEADVQPSATPTAGIQPGMDTPTPTPGLIPVEDTPTAEPSATAWPTDTPTITPTLTLTPTALPTETASPSETASPTATITPTATVEPTPEGGGALGQTFTLVSSESEIAPGDVVTITWEANGWSHFPDVLELSLSYPATFQFMGGSGAEEVEEGRITLVMTETLGSASWYLPAEAEPPYGFQAELRVNGKLVTSKELEVAKRPPAHIQREGGRALGFNGKVKVDFPAESLPEAIEVTIRPPLLKEDGWESLSGRPVEIIAVGLESGQEVHQFNAPISITVGYDPQQIQGDEGMLKLNYFDEETQTWEPVRSQVDLENHTVTGWMDHLTIADINAENWEAARLPSLKEFQVSTFTGAASYAYPIQVPPGPGGLQPSVSLTYSSLAADSASGNSQASWVGMGWSLDVGSIERNMNGTMRFLNDDTFTIATNGVSGLMLEGTDGYYHTTDESFWRIDYDAASDSWTAWDKTGNIYTFGAESGDRASYPLFDPTNCSTSPYGYLGDKTYKWMLSSVENIFGKTITYSYIRETKNVDGVCSQDGTTHAVNTAIYPDDIRYANNHYRVRFVRASGRGDQVHEWEHNNKLVFYMGSRLTTIWVEHNPDGDSAFSGTETVRKYALTYTKDGTLSIDPVFPGYLWEDGDYTLTLGKIQEYGWDGTSTLPAVTFGYEDGMHLTWADNGYGGKVEFSYTLWNDVDTTKGQTLTQAFHGGSGDPCSTGDTGGWSSYGGATPVCTGSPYYDLRVYTAARKLFSTGMFHPGGVYLLSAAVKATSGTVYVSLGLEDGNTATYSTAVPVTTGNYQTVQAVLILPADSLYHEDSTKSKFLISCSDCKVNDFEAKWLPTYYRVTAKTLRDTLSGNTITYNYVYDGAATNDAATSSDVANVEEFFRYYPAYGEFRGHSMVQEVGPDNQVTTSFFFQDDERRGRSSATLVGTREFWEPFDNPSTSNWTFSGWGTQQTVSTLQGDLALQSTNTVEDWSVSVTRAGYPVAEGETALVQFMVSGTGTQAVLAMHSGTWNTSGYRRYGIKVQSDNSVMVHSYIGTTSSNVTLPGFGSFVRDQWYVLLLAVDDEYSYLRLWKRDDPGGAVGYQKNMSLSTSSAMQFLAQTNNGSLWLDSYMEGRLYSLSDTHYYPTSTAPVQADQSKLPKKEGYEYWYTELSIAWVRAVVSRSLDFNGDGEFSARKSEMEYVTSDQNGTQYGNLTRSYESKGQWSGDSYTFTRYRASKTQYYPTVNADQYLTGLPGYSNGYQCPGGGCDFGTDDLLSSVLYLYDDHIDYDDYDDPPTDGILTAQRSFLRWNTPPTSDPRYADQRYLYDDWGNLTTRKVYTKEGTGTTLAWNLASPGEQVSTTTYDSAYHTYPIQETNAKGQSTNIAYENTACTDPQIKGYRIGAPTSMTDANSAVTNICYDVFGRMTRIIRYPEDSSSSPTVRISYYDTAQPFWTQVEQKLDASMNFTVRKFYNGLGQQIQSQVAGAQLTDGTCNDLGHNPDWCDVVVDSRYDESGRLEEQSVPYPLLFYTGYHTPETGQPHTHYTYDALGRSRLVTSPDGSSVETVYPESPSDSAYATEIKSYDQNDNLTSTFLDVWGRTGKVVPATGPLVTYTYNTSDQLTDVDYGSAHTYLSYDNAGRKTGMIDPDMGSWSYVYDALGNLSTQTDARGCTTTLSYDLLNRVTLKNYDDVNCFGTTDVSYTYDGGTNQKGHRTYMSYGTDYNTTWTYDARGRMTSETKEVGSGNTFLTQWSYNSADLVTSMTYPGGNGGEAGEVVNYTYYKQKTVDTVIGTGTYVYDTEYEAAGRVDYRKLDPADGTQIKQDYVYNAWTTDGGRLSQILAGLTTDTDSLQDLRYTYDDAGNVLTIKDYKDMTGSDPQTQTFTYDALNRLASARAQYGLNGTYALENYTYDTDGNLDGKAGVEYTYDEYANGGNLPAHGVRRANKTGGTNKTVTIRAKGSICDGGWPEMKLYVNGVVRYTTTVNTTTYTNYTVTNVPLSGSDIIEVVFTNDCSGNGDRNLYVDYIVVDGQTIQAEGGAAVIDKGAGSAAFDDVNVIVGQETIYWSGSLRFAVGTGAFAGGYDANGNMTVRVANGAGQVLAYDAENRLVQVSTSAATATFVYDGDGNRVKGTTTAGTIIYIGNYFEYVTGSGDKKLYYYAGGVRVAMRVIQASPYLSTLYYQLSDHLGSNAVVADTSGNRFSEVRYKAWGEDRYVYGTVPTTYKFTGQRQESSIGLYFYGARFYDSSLGRFISADTFVAGGVQGFDRYAYVRNNPLRYVDPTGHSDKAPWWEIGLNATTWVVGLSVNLSSSIPINPSNGLAAQYQYQQSSPNMPYPNWNLCGYISLQMIYETVTGKTNTLEYIYSTYPDTGKLDTGEIGMIFGYTFSGGWTATTYQSDWVCHYKGGNPSSVSGGATGTVWHHYNSAYVRQKFINMLSAGHYLIAGVGLDTGTGYLSGDDDSVGHWVVISAIDEDYIYINNPYYNRPEMYTWDEFYNAFEYWLVEIIPPTSYPQQDHMRHFNQKAT